jgi:hypothetical protein
MTRRGRPGAAQPEAGFSWTFGGWLAAALAALSVLLVWLLPAGLLISASDTDVVGQFIAWRSFAVARILDGDLPFWNPYTYAGQPFLAGFQSAMFYPPNVVFLLVPIERAINLSFLLHLVGLGWGMAVWARQRGCHPAGAAIAGIVLPLSGPVFPHLYAGHLSNVCTMAWAPWILVGFDRWCADRDRRALLVATAAAAMQVLAGHVQYALYGAIAMAAYGGVVLVVRPPARRRALPGLVAIYGGAAALVAVQLLPSLSAATEILRGGLAAFSYVRVFSFPPENLLTLIAPGFFGAMTPDSVTPAYWGRAYLWELSLFIGAGGLVLAAAGVEDRFRRQRRAALYLAVPLGLGVLALGANTPLLGVLYDWIPGFGTFRGLSKFTFPFMLFAALAIGAGTDAIAARRLPKTFVTGTIALIGVGFMGAGAWLLASPDSLRPLLRFVRMTGESGLPPDLFENVAFAHAAGRYAGLSLGTAGLFAALAAGSLLLAVRRPWCRFVPLAALPLEILGFSLSHLDVARVSDAVPDQIRSVLSANPGDHRILNTLFPNNGFLSGVPDGGGNDPAVLRRYAELVTASEGADPADATQHLPFSKLGPLTAMLRIRFAFLAGRDRIHMVENQAAPWPRLLLMTRFRVQPDRRALLAEIAATGFNPADAVLLEREPDPAPVPGASPGRARLLSETSDTLEIEVETARPALLVITDTFSRDWRARSVGSGPPTTYDVLAANYVLRAIPLTAGRHRLRLEYVPSCWMVGVVTSLLAAAAWVVLWTRRAPAATRI